ncbi:hypothetical protein ABEB36_010485 [Hypothenemus hampei]|uniref:AAA+ ATPase domain-containing protein n=1 Tax=Hypothenemus hampei TaxID=57062 RepID=A0ABD1EKF1_HYPHA
MKSITDYLKSPSKSKRLLNSENNVNSSNASQRGLNNDLESAQNKKLIKKRQKHHKPADPEVKNVEELLQINLNLKYPTISATNISESLKQSQLENVNSNKQPQKLSERSDDELGVVELTNNVETSASKIDAFQVLMNSTNNIIGTNSEGNSLRSSCHVSEEILDQNKEKLKIRKSLFKDLSEQRGAAKRKREEEDLDKTIKLKLERRARRLKKLLRVQDEDISHFQEDSIIFRKKKPRCISSSDSDSNSQLPAEHYTKKLEYIEENTQDVIISSPLKPVKGNNLLNFLGAVNKTTKTDTVKVVDESLPKSSDVIKIKLFSPQCVNKTLFSQREKCSKINVLKQEEQKEKSKVARDDRNSSLNNTIDELILKDSIQIQNISNSIHSVSSEDSPEILNGPKYLKKKHKTLVSGNEYNEQNISDISTLEDFSSPRRSIRKRLSVNYKELDCGLGVTTRLENKKRKTLVKEKKSKVDIIEKINLRGTESRKKSAPIVQNKMAPVFLKTIPKPKIDPEVVEARKRFLLSGVPDSLKKNTLKQKRTEERGFNVFPKISHIQQKCKSSMWSLTKPNLDIKYDESSSLEIELESLKFQGLTDTTRNKINLFIEEKQLNQSKQLIHQIKAQNPDYPVYKVFKSICERNNINTKRNTKRSPKKSKKKSVETNEFNGEKHEMWTEKYKPLSSKEIIGNHQSVEALKKWLDNWKLYSQDVNSKKKLNSDANFDCIDSESRDSGLGIGTTMVLYGPCGCGKTSAVYAIANELNFNVIELNASIKRTGKKLLQELQEATQSHQVRKKEMNTFFSTISRKAKIANTEENSDARKMCILLIEDIDLIFEQDEGFLTSLSQLTNTSKRPIILTTTDITPVHVQKFINQHQCIAFHPLSARCLSVWLQIICLVEQGMLIEKDDIGHFLNYNRGDIRKTLLEIQFWSQSGGQINRNRSYAIKTTSNRDLNDIISNNDDEVLSEPCEKSGNSAETYIHRNCLDSFEIFNRLLPQNIKLGSIWWNFSNLLDINVSHQADENINGKKKLKSLLAMYDSLIFTDTLTKSLKCDDFDYEPIMKSWSMKSLDSLELNENSYNHSGMFQELSNDICHTLVNGHLEYYNKINGSTTRLNKAMPNSPEKSWRNNQHACEKYLKESLSQSTYLERQAVALDYLPNLRHIARSEEKRAILNTKRGNRFRHYFRDLNVTFKPNLCKLASTVLFKDS